MRNLLAFLALSLLVIAGAGWYLGWYKVQSAPAAVEGHHSINVDVDKKKISDDLRRGEERIQKALETDPQSGKPTNSIQPVSRPSGEPSN